MKLSLSMLALFVASTSVSAACHRRRSTIPVAASNAADVDRRAIDPMVSTPREVVRRHKGGRRLERRGPPAQGESLPNCLATPVLTRSFRVQGTVGNNREDAANKARVKVNEVNKCKRRVPNRAPRP